MGEWSGWGGWVGGGVAPLDSKTSFPIAIPLGVPPTLFKQTKGFGHARFYYNNECAFVRISLSLFLLNPCLLLLKV